MTLMVPRRPGKTEKMPSSPPPEYKIMRNRAKSEAKSYLVKANPISKAKINSSRKLKTNMIEHVMEVRKSRAARFNSLI